MLHIEQMTLHDFHQIVERLEDFWGTTNEKLLTAHHPMFFYEFGDTAFVAKDDERIVAYVFGFVSQTDPETAYGHVMGSRPDYRALGVIEALYEHFAKVMKSRGCTQAKHLVPPGNFASIRYHIQIGCVPVGVEQAGEGQIPVVKDYWARGVNRVVFMRKLP